MISSILRKFLTFLSIFFFNKKISTLKDKKILNKIKTIINKNRKYQYSLTKTHKKFNLDVIKLLKNKKIKNFLKVSFIQKMFFIHNRFFIYLELKCLKNSKKWFFYKKLLKEDNVGSPVRYFLYPKSSGNKINHVFHLYILMTEFNIDIKKIAKVFEFGSGYGCMARIFSQINKDIKYTCFDTFYVSLLQFYFLKHNNLDVGYTRTNQFSLNIDLNQIKNYNLINSNYLFIANWSLSETPLYFREKLNSIIMGSEYILIGFQEKFENINNLKYFAKLEKKISNIFDVRIVKNKYYKGNLINRQNHYYFLGKKK